MNRLERRIERLERGAHVGADVERARAVFHAYEMVRHHLEEATDEDRALAAVTSHDDWMRAFWTLVDAAGGLEAAVRASYLCDEGTEGRTSPAAIGVNPEANVAQVCAASGITRSTVGRSLK
jgi:hypothetical protein